MTKRDRAIAIGAGVVLCIILAFSIYQGVKARQENNGPTAPSSTYIPILSERVSSEEVSSEESSVPTSSAKSQSADLLTQLEEGDFTNLVENTEEGVRVSTVKTIKTSYEVGIRDDNIEWKRYDLNGDNIDELIWQASDSYNKNMKRIQGIFVQESGKTKCVLWDDYDSTEYYFLSPAGNMIYYYSAYGIVSQNIYRYHIFDKEWYPEYQYELEIMGVNETTFDSDPEWKTKNPDMQKVGVYYSKYTETGKEIKKEALTEQEFRAKFKKLMGVDFDEMKSE